MEAPLRCRRNEAGGDSGAPVAPRVTSRTRQTTGPSILTMPCATVSRCGAPGKISAAAPLAAAVELAAATVVGVGVGSSCAATLGAMGDSAAGRTSPRMMVTPAAVAHARLAVLPGQSICALLLGMVDNQSFWAGHCLRRT